MNLREKKARFFAVLLFLALFSFLILLTESHSVSAGCCLNPDSAYLCSDASVSSCCEEGDLACENNEYTADDCSSLPECEIVCCCIYDGSEVKSSEVTVNISCQGESHPLEEKSCSDVCEDYRPLPITEECTLDSENPTTPLSHLTYTFDYSGYPRKIILDWSDVCNNELVSYNISRVNVDTGVVEYLDNVFEPHYEDTTFNFSMTYEYVINATYTTGHTFEIRTGEIYTGDVECWLHPPGQFCIDRSYYLRYMGYFGYSDEVAFIGNLSNLIVGLDGKEGNGFYCDGNNELQPAATCDSNHFCVRQSDGKVTCSRGAECESFNYDLGINPERDSCHEQAACYFEEGVGLTGLCLSCEAPYLFKSCYSYKSRYACEQDECGFALSDAGCEWISINDELGLGTCIDPSSIQCGDCERFTSSVYTSCNDLFHDDPRFSGCAVCGLVSSCANYTQKELCIGESGKSAEIDPETHEITPSDDFCGLGVCDYVNAFGTWKCVKDIDLKDNYPDCTFTDPIKQAQCESDIYPPEIRLVQSFYPDNFGLKDSLEFVVSDKKNIFGDSVFLIPGQQLPDKYAIYVCSGSKCDDDHLSWTKFEDKTTISACELYESNVIDFSDPDTQTLKYFIKDAAGNVGVVNSIDLKTDPTRICTPGETRPCLLQNGVCNGTIQHCVEVCEGVGFYDLDCNISEYNSTGKYEIVETTPDGLDNDCDGLIDEDVEKEYLCNGLDDDHDGFVDEGWPDFDKDNTNQICDYSQYDSKIIDGQTYHYFKIKSDIKLSELGYRYDAKYCGADCVDLDVDNDGVVDFTSTGEVVDKDNRTVIGCIVHKTGQSELGLAIDSDNDGVCDGLDKCPTLNPECEVNGYDYPNKDLIGCPVDCLDSSCLGDPYCQEQCDCATCEDFYGTTCDYSKCTQGCGCYYQESSGSCLDCSTVHSCESYQDARSCGSNSCNLLAQCAWDDDEDKCYTDNDGDGLPDSKDPCPFDSQNDYDSDGFCFMEANKDLINTTITLEGRTFVLKGGFDCNDRDKHIYPRENYSEGANSKCDLKDNDCDGLVDENCPCITDDFRACGNPFLDYTELSVCKQGIQRCINDTWSDVCFDFVGPEVENEAEKNLEGLYCDGFDNDCNGIIDDECSCLPDQTVPCGTDLGICERGYRECGADFKFKSVCVDAIGPEEEVCGDYLDNDCDGSVDEGCPCVEGETMPCPDSTSFVFSFGGTYKSACKWGEQQCISGVWTTCLGFEGPEVLEESSDLNPLLCDSKDNDCDGLIDETCSCFSDSDCRTNCGWGVQICNNGILSDVCEGVTQPSQEVEGDGDEDCDGLTDEGVPEHVCDGVDNDDDGWIDDGFDDWDKDNDPRVCDFSNPTTVNGKKRFKTKDGFWCGADCIDLDMDNDNVLDNTDEEPATHLGCRVNSNGVAIDSDNDGVCDSLDQCEELLPGCEVYGYGEENPGCPLNCADPSCLNSTYCKCPSCDVCENAFNMPQGCDSLHCSYCDFGNCALSYSAGTQFCDDCDSKESCADYLNQQDCEKNPCLDNVSCVWNGSSCLTDSDGDGLSDSEDPCPQDVGNDKDNDGYCEKVANQKFIDSGELFGSRDCDDNDDTIHIGCGCVLDWDGDGYGDNCYWGNDCNDRDPTRNTLCENGCKKDMDGDGYGLGCDLGPDCDDYDASLTTQCTSEDLCFDGVLDGEETDVDCGGVCNPCDAGKQCKYGSDCKSGVCNRGLCYDEELCNNNEKDEFEADIDCGGPCELCDNGKFCTKDDHCKSNNCIDNKCVDPSCEDNKKNGYETDVDCGGRDCAPCETGKKCDKDTDCRSRNCDLDTHTCEGSSSSDKDQDSDADGIPDYWEDLYDLDKNDASDALLDFDDDELSNLEEYKLSLRYTGLNPRNPDTDGDGFSDGKEIERGTNPVVPNKRSHLGLIITLIILGALATLSYIFRDKILDLLDKYGIIDKVWYFLKKYGIIDFVYRKILKKEPPVYNAIRHTKAPKVIQKQGTQKVQNTKTNTNKQVTQTKSSQKNVKPKISEKLDKKIKEKSKIFDAFESQDSSKEDNDEDLFKEFEK